MVNSSDVYTVDVVVRAMDILALLAQSRQPLGAAEVAAGLGLTRNAAFRILTTLKSRGYVTQDDSSRKYHLGLELFYLGNSAAQWRDIRQLALPFMENLRNQYQETANLALLHGTSVLYVQRLESPHSLRMSTDVGTRYPLYCTALGKAILAHLTSEQVASLLGPEPFPRMTENTITGYNQLNRELEKIRGIGYAVDLEERGQGVCCVAAAILREQGNPIGALSLSGPLQRMVKHLQKGDIGSEVEEAAQRISRFLGGVPPSLQGTIQSTPESALPTP